MPKPSACERKLVATQKRCAYWAGVLREAEAAIARHPRSQTLAALKRRARDAAHHVERLRLAVALYAAQCALQRATPETYERALAEYDAAELRVVERLGA